MLQNSPGLGLQPAPAFKAAFSFQGAGGRGSSEGAWAWLGTVATQIRDTRKTDLRHPRSPGLKLAGEAGQEVASERHSRRGFSAPPCSPQAPLGSAKGLEGGSQLVALYGIDEHANHYCILRSRPAKTLPGRESPCGALIRPASIYRVKEPLPGAPASRGEGAWRTKQVRTPRGFFPGEGGHTASPRPTTSTVNTKQGDVTVTGGGGNLKRGWSGGASEATLLVITSQQ